jgi:hypothetical protein
MQNLIKRRNEKCISKGNIGSHPQGPCGRRLATLASCSHENGWLSRKKKEESGIGAALILKYKEGSFL